MDQVCSFHFKINPEIAFSILFYITGRGNGFEIGVSQVPCQQNRPDGAIIVGGGRDEKQPIGGQGYYPGSNYVGENIRDSYGSPAIPSYNIPSGEGDGFGKPIFATLPASNSYGPIENLEVTNQGPLNEEQEIVVSLGQPDSQIFEVTQRPGILVPPRPSYNSPSNDNSLFYGSTQTSSFIGNPQSGSTFESEFKPSIPIVTNSDINKHNQVISSFRNPTSQVLVVEELDSYGAPVGPLLTISDDPEIISTGPGFFNPSRPFKSNEQPSTLIISSHQPTESFDVPPVNSYGGPIAPTIRPNFPSFNNQIPNIPISPPSTDYGAPSDPIFPPTNNYGPPLAPSLPPNPPRDVFRGPSTPNFPSDSYGAPEAPVLPPNFPSDTYGAPVGPVLTPNFPSDSYGAPVAPVLPPNLPSDGYGAPLAPVLPSKPPYNPQNPTKPNYRPQGKFPNFLGPIAGLLDAKRRAIANLFSGFRKSRLLRPASRPNYNQVFMFSAISN